MLLRDLRLFFLYSRKIASEIRLLIWNNELKLDRFILKYLFSPLVSMYLFFGDVLRISTHYWFRIVCLVLNFWCYGWIGFIHRISITIRVCTLCIFCISKRWFSLFGVWVCVFWILQSIDTSNLNLFDLKNPYPTSSTIEYGITTVKQRKTNRKNLKTFLFNLCKQLRISD